VRRLLRPLRPQDVADVVALNARHVELTAPMDADRLAYLARVGRAERICVDRAFAGFVVTVASEAAYDGSNFAWFGERYDRFAYLDRIVVHEDFRRLGLAGRVYDELETRPESVPLLTLEVNSAPPNEASLAFHHGRGFEAVGEREFDGHRVAMLVKRTGGTA
jgi:predicted GNAT superfamily acetyltransferase